MRGVERGVEGFGALGGLQGLRLQGFRALGSGLRFRCSWDLRIFQGSCAREKHAPRASKQSFDFRKRCSSRLTFRTHNCEA